VTPLGTTAMSKGGRNAVVTSLVVCCGYIVCWSSNEITYSLRYFGYIYKYPSWYYHFTSVTRRL